MKSMMPTKASVPKRRWRSTNGVNRSAARLPPLPAHYRVVIELRHYQELSYEEIAVELNIPLSDVKSHLFRARKILAEKLHAPDG